MDNLQRQVHKTYRKRNAPKHRLSSNQPLRHTLDTEPWQILQDGFRWMEKDRV
ncbi:hypothetical protein AG0111_0g12286 [Alternaria gaisen]|uniref:Uncharacterized protein n=1 Tax=Alternaria gaisen TaxID=167740 RepID=A0ACB6F4R2_9PLEO|nr:hypothetical protein AG0111_0g12286 [Alternaria gaisen]